MDRLSAFSTKVTIGLLKKAKRLRNQEIHGGCRFRLLVDSWLSIVRESGTYEVDITDGAAVMLVIKKQNHSERIIC